MSVGSPEGETGCKRQAYSERLMGKWRIDGLSTEKYMKLGCFQYNALFQLLISHGEYCCIHFKERDIDTQ